MIVLRPVIRRAIRPALRTLQERGAGGLRPPVANMVAWYRKGMGITSSGGAVSAWADQTGLGGRDYAQATGASQPTLQAGGTLLFDGAADFLKTPAFALVQPYTRYLRVRQITWTSGEYLADGNTLNTGVVLQSGASPNLAIYAGTTAATNGGLAVGSWGSLGAVFNGASSVLQIGATTTTGAAGAGNAGGLTLGASSSGTLCSNIEVAEEIVYNVAHDAATRDRIIAYLNTL